MTFGQAVDKAIETHTARYPGSEVYNVHVDDRERGGYYVTIRAGHFSTPLVYEVSADRAFETLPHGIKA